MLSDFIDWGLLLVMLITHELAHYIDAKRLGIYEGVFFTGITMGVRMKDQFPNRWLYFGGIVFSMLPYPLALWLSSVGLADYRWWWMYPVAALLFGIGDIAIFIWGYSKYRKNMKFYIERDTFWNRLWLKLWGLDPKDAGIIWVYRRR